MQRMNFFKFISSSNFQNKKAFKGTIHIYSNNMIIKSELIGTELILCNFKRLATYTASSVYRFLYGEVESDLIRWNSSKMLSGTLRKTQYLPLLESYLWIESASEILAKFGLLFCFDKICTKTSTKKEVEVCYLWNRREWIHDRRSKMLDIST